MHIQTEPNEVHIWVANLSASVEQIESCTVLLSPDELEKAKRFRFDTHRNRYTIARGILRTILALYLDMPADKIVFSYLENGKPYIADTSIQFNLSHSENMAVYAIVDNQQIGVDIEVIKDTFNAGVATRYYSPDENQAITNLTPDLQAAQFYRIWSRKEAVIKATGKDLSIVSPEFSTLPDIIHFDNENWHLITLDIDDNYAAALAVTTKINKISYWDFTNGTARLKRHKVLGSGPHIQA